MLWLAAAFASGVSASAAAAIDFRLAGIAGVMFLLLAAAFRMKPSSAWLVLAGFAASGSFAVGIEKHTVASDRIQVLIDNGKVPTGVPVEIVGTLIRAPEASPEGFSLTIYVKTVYVGESEIPTGGPVRLYIRTGSAESKGLAYGATVKALAKLRRDDEYLNPGVIRQREILDQLQLDAFGSVRDVSALEVLRGYDGFSPLAQVYDQRARAIETMRANLSPQTAGVMIASLLGNDQFLDKQTADLFREGGTYHLLVISGLHLTVIGAILLFFLSKITRNRWLHFGVTTAALWTYALAVGAESPVARAATMFTILLFGYAVRRDKNSLNLLGLTALILLIYHPASVFSPSFQLTFVSVGTVFAVVVPLLSTLREIGAWTPTSRQPFPPDVSETMRSVCEWLYWNPADWSDESRANIWSGSLEKAQSANLTVGNTGRQILVYLFELSAASSILQIALLPMSVLYFHRVSVSAVVNNLWAGAVMGAESISTILGIIISALSNRAASGCFGLAEVFNRLLFVTAPLERIGWLSFRVPEYSGFGRMFYLLIGISLCGLAIALSRWRLFELKRSFRYGRQIAATLVTCLLLSAGILVFHPLSAPRPDGRLRIDFLDVGQGDSALVTFPNGETMLVDAGGSPEFRDAGEKRDGDEFEPDHRGVGEAVVSEFLWHRGYSSIDYILGTHSDGDHIGGMPDVARNFSTKAVMLGRIDENEPTRRLLEVLDRGRVPVETLHQGDNLEIGGVRIRVLNPPENDQIIRGSANNSSVVLRLEYGNVAILMTGDIEEGVENRLAAEPDLLRADVVKVAHHGSKTSSTEQFVELSRPALAVISVGRRSPYGHPHPTVLDRWRNAGTDVITTGEKETVTVRTDGREIDVSTYLP